MRIKVLDRGLSLRRRGWPFSIVPTMEIQDLQQWLNTGDIGLTSGGEAPQEFFVTVEFPDGEQWRIDRRGQILDPGKFEGQDILVPLLWGLTQIQGEDDVVYFGDQPWSLFNFSGEGDWEGIPYSFIRERMGRFFGLYESESGFVGVASPADESLDYRSWVEALEMESMGHPSEDDYSDEEEE